MVSVNDQREYAEWSERSKLYLKHLEDVTSKPREEQERVLKHILEKNAKTEYLQKHGLNGATDVETFKQSVPVVHYEAYRDIITRIADGDETSILSADPPKLLLVSSGTSSGDPKIFPVTAEDVESRSTIWNLMGPVLNRLQIASITFEGKCIKFNLIRPGGRTRGGLETCSASISHIRSEYFRNRRFDPTQRLTSPPEVYLSSDTEGAFYCHVLCGLLQRLEVVLIGSNFPYPLLKAIRLFETLWPEICEDIAKGTLSSVRVKDENIRLAVLPLLRQDPELADLVRNECSKKVFPESHGIIRRLWPNVEVVATCTSGSMAAYLPVLANLSDNLRVINSSLYACSEGFFGINLHPECLPEEVCYTLLPSAAYFEFVPVEGAQQDECYDRQMLLQSRNQNQSSEFLQVPSNGMSSAKNEDAPSKVPAERTSVLDLASVKVGKEYELIVTTLSGLYRLHVGDILKVVGFYNSTPKFQFVNRKNVVLSVATDKTDEQDLQRAVNRASSEVLEKEMPGLTLQDYTSCTDFSTSPGHYVIYWELSKTEEVAPPSVDVLERCCSTMEASLNFIYRASRCDDTVGPLELRLVEKGTFDRMFEQAIGQGSAVSQYKTPRGLRPKHSALLQILVSRTVCCHVTQTPVPFTTREHIPNITC